jgi:hypothetical protein
MSKIPLFASLATERLVNRDGGNATLPPFVFGDTKVFTLETLESTDTGLQVRNLNVRSLRATLGRVQEPPTAGTFTLRANVASKAAPTFQVVDPNTLEYVWIYHDGVKVQEFNAPNDFPSQALAYFNSQAAAYLSVIATENEDDEAVYTFTGVQPGNVAVVKLRIGYTKNVFSGFVEVSTTVGAPVPVFSAEITPRSTPAAFAQALAPVLTIAEPTQPAAGLWVFRLPNRGQLPASFNVGANRLAPRSFVRIRSYEADAGEWWHEVQLIQTPAASNSAFARVLPPAPSVERVRAGAARNPGSSANTNEVQRIKIPRDFRGTFSLTFDFRRTGLLSPQTPPEEMQAALNALFLDGKQRFAVSVIEADFAHVEFVGPLESSPQNLISVQVESFEPGVMEFALFLGRPEMAALLRDRAEIELPFEIELEVVDDDEDAANPAIPGRAVTIAQTKVKVTREQAFEELREVQSIDWLKPPALVDYIPFTPDQVITGQQHYTAIFGNGLTRVFSFGFNLATPWISGVVVRENKPLGRVFVNGTDYTLAAGNDAANELVLTVANSVPMPALNSLAICITTAGPKSAFQAHTHTVGQIVGLQELLDVLAERLTNIEDKLPFTAPGTRDADASAEQVFEIPNFATQYPGRYLTSDFSKPVSIARPPRLLPAIHDAAAEQLEAGPLPAANASRYVIENAAVDSLALDAQAGAGNLQVKVSHSIKTGDSISLDGETWYTVGLVPLSGTYIPITPALAADAFTDQEVYRRNFDSYAGDVLVYTGNAPLLVPGRRGALKAGAIVGSDGRSWYPLTWENGTTSFYPADMERELFTFPLNEKMLRPGGELELEFAFAAKLVNANTAAQLLLVVEFGTTPNQVTPATTGVNLSDVTWNAAPLLSQRIILTGQRVDGKFGVAIRRSLQNAFAADRLLYGIWEAAGATPNTANLVLRARVKHFDTENSQADARGAVWLSMTEAEAKISNL